MQTRSIPETDMHGAQAVAADPAVLAGFQRLGAELRASLPQDALQLAASLHAALPDWQRASRFSDLGERFAAAAAAARGQLEAPTRAQVSRLLVAELASALMARLADRNLTRDVLVLVPAAMARLLQQLGTASGAGYEFPDDDFVKDLRFAAGLTVPGGAEVLDLRSKLGTRASLQFLARRPSLGALLAMLGNRSIDPWFRIHTEKRYLRHFHAPGWDAFYRRVASMLHAHPKVHGVVGTSWFFDPQLETISPRLAYLRSPLAHGAFLVRGQTTAFDIASATVNSEARQALVAQGRYTPTPYTLVWPRDAVLRWAAAPASAAAAD